MKSRVVAAAAVLALTLTACGSAESSSDSDEPAANETTAAESAPTEASPSPEAEATAASPDAADADLTPPGTELAVGDWATVPFSYANDKEGVLRVRVASVDTGSQDDFAVFDQSTRNKLKGFTPRYVRLEIEQVSGSDLAYASVATNFSPITASGEEAQELAAIGTFEPCKSGSFPSGFGPGSKPATSCVIGLVPGGGDDVVGGSYSQRDSAYDSYEGEPVVWK